MLYPQETETRETRSLNGLWRFRRDRDEVGVAERWMQAPLVDTVAMPVPASYNDLTQDGALRDHIGLVWYERRFFVPAGWRGKDIVLRFGAVAHRAAVHIDGQPVGEHTGGFLPFEFRVTPHVTPGREHRLTVAVDNRLHETSFPLGVVEEVQSCRYAPKTKVQTIHFDFFNYAGIHRDVSLLCLPPRRIEDIAITTSIEGVDGVVHYDIAHSQPGGAIAIEVLDPEERVVATASGESGAVRVREARLWDLGQGHLYHLEVRLLDADGAPVDRYRQRFGIRTVAVEGSRLLLNGRPIYLTGYGKHEDSVLRGRGFDPVVLVKDYNLMEWMGANSFRTSHYPYAEEWLEMADERGMLVIDECPAAGMLVFKKLHSRIFAESEQTAQRLENHLQILRDLVARDRNHPSVVAWCVANEAATWEAEARPYFERVIAETRRLDPSRPVMIANFAQPQECKVSDLVDLIGVNRYPSWYTDPGRLEVVEEFLESELMDWHRRFGKPILISEHGTDTVAGLHADPPALFSEEYQCRFYEECHKAFDRLDFVVGEHVWNFADFQTKQGINRVDGNKKGLFTRDRKPKMAAHLLKKRWEALGGSKPRALPAA